MDAMCKHGSYKLVSRATGWSAKTVETYLREAGMRMGMRSPPLLKYLRWNEWRKGCEHAQSCKD